MDKIKGYNCPICDKERLYKSKAPINRYKDKPCKSCSNSIQRGGKGDIAAKDGLKTCLDCNNKLSIEDFYIYSNKRIHSVCKTCSHKRSSKYHTTDYRFRKYGLTLETFNEKVKGQNNRCKICYKESKLFIDHCHKSGNTRGLLCGECNSALGLLKEDKEIINNMLEYIEFYG